MKAYKHPYRFRVKFYFCWYDGWVGFRYARISQVLYLQLFPTLGVKMWREDLMPVELCPRGAFDEDC